MSRKKDRPTVGIALSGGGIRGLAHIGVLKALRAQGVPIDFIAGTSAGAIVGALYATGYTVRDWRRSHLLWRYRSSLTST